VKSLREIILSVSVINNIRLNNLFPSNNEFEEFTSLEIKTFITIDLMLNKFPLEEI